MAVQDSRLTITVPKDALLVDGAYLDDTHDLPFEVRCQSEGDKIALEYHLNFIPGSHTLEKLDDARFDLLQDSDKLGAPMRLCILRRGDPGKSCRQMQSFVISSAENSSSTLNRISYLEIHLRKFRSIWDSRG